MATICYSTHFSNACCLYYRPIIDGFTSCRNNHFCGYRNDLLYRNYKIQITFSDEYGLPADRTGLEIALDDVKPAHLPIVYLVKYLMLSDVEAMTLATLETHKLSDFAFE